jgi:hypothetical protein
MQATRTRGSDTSLLIDAPTFDFSVGGGLAVAKTDLQTGDVVRTSCTYQNAGDKSVGFGEATGDEMCFGFMMYYPRIDSPLWGFAAPAALGECTTTSNAL